MTRSVGPWLLCLATAGFLIGCSTPAVDNDTADATEASAEAPEVASESDEPVVASEEPDVLEAARARLDALSGPPEFVPPGEPYDMAAALGGSTVMSVPVHSAIDFSQFYAQAMERLSSDVGFTLRVWENGGTPTEWARGIETAVNAEADLIDLFGGIDPALVTPQLRIASDAGIPVIASTTYDVDQERDTLVNHTVPLPGSVAARLMVDWVAVQSDGSASVLVLTSSDVKASAAAEEAFRDQFGLVCPECSVKYVDVPTSEWATRTQSEVQSALVADPELDYVLPIYDTMAIWTLQAIQQAGRTDDVRIVSYNGTPSILEMMTGTDVIEMLVGQSNDWMAHLVLDQIGRLAAGLDVNPDATWPLRIWTHDNLPEAGDPPSDSQGYGDAYATGFRTLWGLD